MPQHNTSHHALLCIQRVQNPEREREMMDGMSMGNMGHKSYTHMTFFWGRNSEILFTGWPGTRTGMLIRDGLKSHRMFAAVLQTLMHTTRIGLAYLLMLALMSFNIGVLIVAILGHGVGFFFFGSRAFKKTPPPGKVSTDLPPMNC
ncbi:copper transporter 2-like [Syzygium oleosum]|uniref:copper transporter 2-like n=1 Tax=Syzygium oleosum TaxID=219896 RepID=UPI0024B9ED9C|nr:copper transporter 2-like [Syzygium oleosum]